MPKLGDIVTVELPEQVTEHYNSQNPGAVPVEVGTVRPAVVVGVTESHEQHVQLPNGQVQNHDVPGSVSLLVFHDGGPAPLFHVQGVPFDALTPAGEQDTEKGDSNEPPEEPQDDGKQGRAWDPNREGNGEPYSGPGPYAPQVEGRYEQGARNTQAPLQGVPPGQVRAPSSGEAQDQRNSPSLWGE